MTLWLSNDAVGRDDGEQDHLDREDEEYRWTVSLDRLAGESHRGYRSVSATGCGYSRSASSSIPSMSRGLG
jgi:hypothetical protein